jgi:hypothetical protein
MKLQNDWVILTLDARAASIIGLYDKTTKIEFTASPSAEKKLAGVAALFADQPFALIGETSNAEGSSAIFASLSHDNSLKLTKAFAIKTGARGMELMLTLENLGALERDILWGERFEFAAESFGPGMHILAPAVSYFDPKEEPVLRMRWPHLADGTDLSQSRSLPDSELKTYFLTDFAEGKCGLASPEKHVAIELQWDAQQYSYCWLDETSQSIALSPFTGMPDAINEGHGTLALPGNGSVSARFTVEIAPLAARL